MSDRTVHCPLLMRLDGAMILQVFFHISNHLLKYFCGKENVKSFSGFKDRQEEWLEGYEIADAPAMMYEAWARTFDIGGEQISLEGFYKQLHAYIRSKLIDFYNEKVRVPFAVYWGCPEMTAEMKLFYSMICRVLESKRMVVSLPICWATCGHSPGSTSKTWQPPSLTLPQSTSHQHSLNR